MKLSSLLTRTSDPVDGLNAVARCDHDTERLLQRLKPGEIAIVDEIDLDRALAERLVQKQVAAVVNAAPFISGRYPNLGPEVLALADIVLVENVGIHALQKIKDGTKITLYEGEIFHNGKVIFSGHEVKELEIVERIVAARSGINDHLEAFASNAIEFIRSEAPLLIDGVGIPEVEIKIADKPVVVVGNGEIALQDLKQITTFIREYKPVLIGVDRGADYLVKQGYKPDIVVGDPDVINSETLRKAKSVILPAEPSGKAKGLYRIQDLGIGAMTFPARGQAIDLALILAHHHGAELIVTVGHQASFEDFFDNKCAATNPSTFLTRLKMGDKLVDAKAVSSLYKNEISLWLVSFFVISALIIVGVVLTLTGVIAPYEQWITVHTVDFYEKMMGFIHSAFGF